MNTNLEGYLGRHFETPFDNLLAALILNAYFHRHIAYDKVHCSKGPQQRRCRAVCATILTLQVLEPKVVSSPGLGDCSESGSG